MKTNFNTKTFIDNIFRLDGKTALITGASSGLGYRFATVLALAGANIIAVGRNQPSLLKLKDELSFLDNKIDLVNADIAHEEDLKKLEKEIRKNKIDILINNAGVAFNTPILSTDEDSRNLWQQQLDVNLNSAWRITQEVTLRMIEDKIKGSIINIASIAGSARPCYESAAYNISKSALMHLTRSLVGELSPHGIRINAILPGLFKTNINSIIKSTPEALEQKVPLKRIASPEELDGIILLLCSNKASSYMTGSLITVDGGLSIVDL